MTRSTRRHPQHEHKVKAMKAEMRAALHALGVSRVWFKTSRLTGNPIAVVETEPEDGTVVDDVMVAKRVIEIGDKYGLVVSMVPALYYRCHVG